MKSRSIFRVLKFVLFAVLFVAILFLLGFVVKEPVELAGAADLRLEIDRVLAGHGPAPPQQASLRRIPPIGWPRLRRDRPRRMRERWEQMTPEQREKFRQGVRGCWDRAVPPDSSPTA